MASLWRFGFVVSLLLALAGGVFWNIYRGDVVVMTLRSNCRIRLAPRESDCGCLRTLSRNPVWSQSARRGCRLMLFRGDAVEEKKRPFGQSVIAMHWSLVLGRSAKVVTTIRCSGY